MAEVLVLVEHVDGTLKKVSAELITAARALGEPSAVVTGPSGTTGKGADALTEAERATAAEQGREQRRRCADPAGRTCHDYSFLAHCFASSSVVCSPLTTTTAQIAKAMIKHIIPGR